MNIEFLERVYIRGLEGLVSDMYMETIVTQEWLDVAAADDVFNDNAESHNIAIQLFFRMKRWAL